MSFSLTVLAVLAAPTSAAPQIVTLDPDETEISFTLGATGHDVEGKLHLRGGEIRLDPESGTASGELTLDATRADTGSKRRDKTMHKKVLETGTHPWIVFKAERIEGTVAATGASEVSLVGTLTLVGKEHPLTLDLAVEVEEDRFTARTRFPVPFVEWGLHDPSFAFLRVAKVVQVSVTARGTLGHVAPAVASPEP